MKKKEVVFCGNSLYLSCLAASLRQISHFRIVQIDLPLPEAIHELQLLCPDVLVSQELRTESTKPLLQQNPELLVIEIEAATDSLTFVHDGEIVMASASDLAKVILETLLKKTAPPFSQI